MASTIPEGGYGEDAGNVLPAKEWPNLGPAFPQTSSPPPTAGFQRPSNPGQPPYDTIAVPAHVSTSFWQESFYDPTSQAPVAGFKKLPSGPADLKTGKIGEPFHQGHHRFKQV